MKSDARWQLKVFYGGISGVYAPTITRTIIPAVTANTNPEINACIGVISFLLNQHVYYTISESG